MKRLLLTLVLMLSLLLVQQVYAADPSKESTVITLKINSSIININGNDRLIDTDGTVPLIENGRTLVPLRTIFEGLSAEVKWDGATQTITGEMGNTKITLTIEKTTAYINGKAVILDVAPKIINSRTLVPLRFVAESLGADVEWNAETQTIKIIKGAKFLSVRNATICLGDTEKQVEMMLGKANRIDPSGYDFKWHVYNSDYSRFIMVGIKNGIVEALYSNSKGFKTNDISYGDTDANSKDGVILYTDKHDKNKIHACLIISDNCLRIDTDVAFFRAQELQILDTTNAFRVNYGLQPLIYDETAAICARKHSQDMADKNYTSHTNQEGLQPWDRFKNSGGTYKSCGENLAAGLLFGIDALDGWVNSEGHRENLLESFKYLGVGYGYNKASTYEYYWTQLFFS